MAKRRSGGRDDGDRNAKRRRQQHLYLLVDDWAWGYSIRKIDLPITDSAADPGEQVARLPHAVFRFEARPNQLKMAAVGTRIIHWPGLPCTSSLSQVTAFDVRSRSLAVAPPQPEFRGGAVLIPVGGDRLFVLSAYSFQVLNDVQCSSPFWEELPVPPLEADHCFASSAVHPDGRTIFVSVKSTRVGPITSTLATYAFVTAAPRSSGARWTKLGDWALPFTSRSHFDADLDAWIGLTGNMNRPRHVCACDVVPVANANSEDGGGRPCPSWKMLEEAPFSAGPACLVPMGRRRSEFCLVHCVDGDVGGSSSFYPRPISERCKFRLVTFSLEYDKNGDLTAGNTRRVRHYRCPEAGGYALLDPAAFWL